VIIKESEKRRFPRVILSTPCSFKIRGTPEFGNGLTKDISATGLRFVSDKYLKPSTDVAVEINVLHRAINPIGRIKWSQPLSHSNRYQMGLEFVELDTESKNYLSDYISLRKFNF
jgi:hypothetical protein